MNGSTKFQHQYRFPGSKRYRVTGIGHDVDFHGVEILFLQRNVQDGIEYLVQVSAGERPRRLVDYAKERGFRVSHYDVLQQIAVDVHGVDIYDV